MKPGGRTNDDDDAVSAAATAVAAAAGCDDDEHSAAAGTGCTVATMSFKDAGARPMRFINASASASASARGALTGGKCTGACEGGQHKSLVMADVADAAAVTADVADAAAGGGETSVCEGAAAAVAAAEAAEAAAPPPDAEHTKLKDSLISAAALECSTFSMWLPLLERVAALASSTKSWAAGSTLEGERGRWSFLTGGVPPVWTPLFSRAKTWLAAGGRGIGLPFDGAHVLNWLSCCINWRRRG